MQLQRSWKPVVRLMYASVLVVALLLVSSISQFSPIAQAAPTGNPIITHRADPSIRLFEGRYWIYPTGSQAGHMFHAYSSADLSNWVDEGVILDLGADVSWANQWAWAPDMVYRNGTYYFYFTADDQRVGVAVCDTPKGPCTDSGQPLVEDSVGGVHTIDPSVFVDDDGQAYLYYGGWGRLATFKLNSDMVSLNGSQVVHIPPDYVEGPWVHKRNGTYYLSYSSGGWTDGSYNVRYATSSSPLGPWNYQGQILSSDGTYHGPGHHSFFQYPGTDDWYIAYHRYEDTGYSSRMLAIDRMYHNAQGQIERIVMTNDGVETRSLKQSSVSLTRGVYQSFQTTTPGYSNAYIRHYEALAYTEFVDGGSSALLKQDATYKIVKGLADARCYSFETRNFPGHYLRHSFYRLQMDARDGSLTFDKDATFCTEPGLSGTGVSFWSYNFPNHYIRHYDAQVWIASNGGSNPWDSSNLFAQDASWNITAPLAP